ncbi:alpha/beta fold hydrolase [Diaphorobacter aerolatus]|uniref:Alpha/beta hydrolase n=1 Tax=Diaphorobacter aerolatus TaxID=1288495 RepID=A0A7H0GKS1_9BURK|nr:alpha/beta hydrolase [Diaphorobacter aerolatus]QNP48887.1 alpha/beta hydrolase [Diaphorobacter aerolatus]
MHEEDQEVRTIPDEVTAQLARSRERTTQYAGRSVHWREWCREQDQVPLIALHGGHGSWLHWLRNIEAFSANYRVLLPDMPGFGESEDFDLAARDPARLDLLTEALCQGIRDLVGTLTPFHLIGFSFGGLIAGMVAARMPQIRTLTLLGTAGHGFRRASEPPMRNWRDFDGDQRKEVLRDNLQAFMLASPADETACWIHAQSCENTRFYSKSYSRKASLAASLGDVKAPVLMLWGENDVTAEPVMAAEQLAQNRTEREWMIIPSAGHWVQYEAAATVNVLLAYWLSQR